MASTAGNAPGSQRLRWPAGLVLLALIGASALAQPPASAELPAFAEDLPAPAPRSEGPPRPATANSIGFAEDVEVAAAATAALALPQSPPGAAAPAAKQPPPASAPVSGLIQASCTNCGAGLLGIGSNVPETAGAGCDGYRTGQCYPGRQPCNPCLAETCLGRCICALYECICCPDPCYEPRWLAVADAAFFVEPARPQTTQRIRWDCGQNLVLADRSEYFWARADGSGKGPRPVAPFKTEPRLRYNELTFYNEGSTGAIGMIFEMPYRSLHPVEGPRSAGFGDITLGTRTLLFDCELIQLTFLMKTFLPAGSPGKGFGVGHVSLEPSVVVGVKLGPETYLQGQVSEWIPLGGDPSYMGAILHHHFSLNQVLFRCVPDVPLIGTLEVNTWHFQDGAYTDPLLGSFQKSSGEAYVMAGVGLRLVVCDRFDIGIGSAFAVTEGHWAEQLYRTEIRWRF